MGKINFDEAQNEPRKDTGNFRIIDNRAGKWIVLMDYPSQIYMAD